MKIQALPAFLVLAAASAVAQPPDRVLHNARVFTADSARPWAEAFALRDGRIVAVGSSIEILALAGPATERLDLGGAFVSPGFGDSHIHFMSGSLTLNAVALNGLGSREEIVARVADYAKANPGAAWITGRGWNYSAFPGGLPRREWLDAAVPDRPVFLESYDGHTGWANSQALSLAAITRDTAEPPNGEIVRNEQGEATGALKEAAQRLIETLIPPPSAEEKYRALKAGLDLAASYGLTFAHNAGFDPDDLSVYERALGEGSLKVRFYNAMYFRPDPDESWLARLRELRARHRSPLFRFGAVKALLDGVVESKTAWMLEPYAQGGGLGSANFPADIFNRSVAAYDREGFQLFVHAIGDRAIRSALDAFAFAARANGARDRRHRVEHIEVPHPTDIARFRPLGVIASTQALFATPDDVDNTSGPYYGNLGPRRAARAMPFKALDDAGAVQAFGSDWPVFSMEVLKGIYTAVTRQSVRGKPVGGLTPRWRISAEAALRHFTTDGAYAAFAEKDFGRISPGLFADFVILSRDITRGDPAEILNTRVLLTVMNGRETYRAAGFTPGAARDRKD